MLAYYAKRSPGEDFERIQTPLHRGVWVDGAELSDREIDSLIAKYELNANIVYDVRDRGELPRLEFSGSDLYVFLRIPRIAKSGRVSALPLLCVLHDGIFLTLSIGETLEPETVALSTLPITTGHTQTLLLGVMAGSVAKFEAMLQHTARSIADTANRLKTHEITNRDFIHFVTVESNLNLCRMNLEAILAVTRRLHENSHDTFAADSLEALDDIALHIQQLLVSIESHVQGVASIRNAYSTVANNTLNQRMKTLTVITVLITLPNVFFGMYGMNVSLPYAHESWGYGVIIGTAIVMTVLVYVIAKRLKIF